MGAYKGDISRIIGCTYASVSPGHVQRFLVLNRAASPWSRAPTCRRAGWRIATFFLGFKMVPHLLKQQTRVGSREGRACH